ncbi:hypothetical protein HXX76_014692 [Chlamydomonas incerta]|uniref:Zinc transporter n=1 Tax=Chlamydomonas incerta TaxID=51695 RepID=A0A835SKT0_CHLIN|nr:hypothetical protein HXX76_014692 [Chlamydomonas incerta]|eukprot:KAG2424159.1 hypothetical protein HXX76_014692 [Chlamydomonas incerta]
MASSGDVALAFGLVIAAGLCTCLGAAIAFCVKVSDTRILAAALGVSAGVMLYVSFVEIFTTKSIQGFMDAGYSDKSAYRYATLLFFGGMAVTWALNQLAHGMLHLAAACQAARRQRGGAGGCCCCGGGGGGCAGLWLRGGGWGRRGAAADVDLGKESASAPPSRQLSALQAGAGRPGSTAAVAQHLTAPAIATAEAHANADTCSTGSSTHGPGCLAPAPADAPVTVLGLTAPSPADVEAGGGGTRMTSGGPAGTDMEREVVAVLVAADDPRDHAHDHTHLHKRSHALPPATCICGTSPGTAGAFPANDPEAGTPPGADGAAPEQPHPQPHSHHQLTHLGLLSGLAVGIHNFPEGLATFVGTLADPTAGVAIAVAIALHNIPEGIVVAMPIYFATGSKWKGFLWSVVCGLSEPLAGLLGWLILRGQDSDPLMYGIMFALVAGMMVYIAAVELLPTALRYDPANQVTTRGLVVGMAVMAASLLLFSAT